jgi:hypothetical protein
MREERHRTINIHGAVKKRPTIDQDGERCCLELKRNLGPELLSANMSNVRDLIGQAKFACGKEDLLHYLKLFTCLGAGSFQPTSRPGETFSVSGHSKKLSIQIRSQRIFRKFLLPKSRSEFVDLASRVDSNTL